MPYQQLVEYIRQNRFRGVGDEIIKQNLINAGWLNEDIIRAFNFLQAETSLGGRYGKQFSQNNQRPVIVEQKSGLGSFAIILIFLILIGSAIGGYFYYTKVYLNPNNLVSVNTIKNSTTKNNQNQNIATTSPIAVDKDLEEVRARMEEIKNGYLKNDDNLILKNSTQATVDILSSQKMSPISAFSINSVNRLAMDRIVVSATAVSNGIPNNQNFVFIQDGKSWKFDMPASLDFSKNPEEQKTINDPNDLPDLKVVEVKLSQIKPIVNDKNFNIAITIKNDGKKVADSVPVVANLIGFEQSVPVRGGSDKPLQPGSIVTWVYYPYEKNQAYKISDNSGEKTLEIILNDKKEIIESDYSNNRLNRIFQVYLR